MRYLAVRGVDNGPLFRMADGTPLKNQYLWRKFETLWPGQELTQPNHSFRIGAATTAAANGINDATIQQLGRWKSDSYVQYIRMPQHQLATDD